MKYAKLIESSKLLQSKQSFLGREFLTWLWFLSEVQNHLINLPKLGEFRFYMDDRLLLSAQSGPAHESQLKGGTPAYAREAKSALLSGKLVSDAKFVLQNGDKEWSWNMKADDLTVRGLRLPVVSESDASSHMMKRIEYIKIFFNILDILFNQFMNLRTGINFDQELESIGVWLERKNNDYV